MEFKETFSREYLRNMNAVYMEKIRISAITDCVTQTVGGVTGAAQQGKLQYMFDPHSVLSVGRRYTPTMDEFLDGLRLKFPGCRIEYEEKWEASPKNPNQMNKKTGIVIDWS